MLGRHKQKLCAAVKVDGFDKSGDFILGSGFLPGCSAGRTSFNFAREQPVGQWLGHVTQDSDPFAAVPPVAPNMIDLSVKLHVGEILETSQGGPMQARKTCRTIYADKGKEAGRGRASGQPEGHLHGAHSDPVHRGCGRKTLA
eukprot:2948064-Pyramimonas_sp.AAC.1